MALCVPGAVSVSAVSFMMKSLLFSNWLSMILCSTTVTFSMTSSLKSCIEAWTFAFNSTFLVSTSLLMAWMSLSRLSFSTFVSSSIHWRIFSSTLWIFPSTFLFISWSRMQWKIVFSVWWPNYESRNRCKIWKTNRRFRSAWQLCVQTPFKCANSIWMYKFVHVLVNLIAISTRRNIDVRSPFGVIAYSKGKNIQNIFFTFWLYLNLSLIVFCRLLLHWSFLGFRAVRYFAFFFSLMKYHLEREQVSYYCDRHVKRNSWAINKTKKEYYIIFTLLTLELSSLTVLFNSLFCCWRLLKVRSIMSNICTQLFLDFASMEPSMVSPS